MGRQARYRWVVLAVFMLVTAANQAGWITFAAITREAAAFYGTSELAVGVLSLSFMLVYVLVVLPSAWAIDTFGLRPAVTLGAALTAVGALGRGLLPSSFSAVLVFQLLIALGQPLILGAITKLAARWFPPEQRGLAVGLGALAIYLGILAGVLCTPMLASGLGISGMLMAWGLVSVVAALAFAAFARERPRVPVSPQGAEERALVFDGLKRMLRNKDFLILLAVFFVGLGMFNGVTTWIEVIVSPRGFQASQAGVAGGFMLVGGIIGAAVVPIISDSLCRRKPFILAALAGVIPSLLGVAFARTYLVLLASCFLLGFFLLSSGPIGFQYGVEITAPAPEGTSNSLLLVMGQISGILFIFGMDGLKAPDGSMTGALVGLAVLLGICLALSTLLAESPVGTGRIKEAAGGARALPRKES